jgi:hypothetical protein
MIFSLFAPTIDKVKLVLDDKDYHMDKQLDGTFLCNVSDICDVQRIMIQKNKHVGLKLKMKKNIKKNFNGNMIILNYQIMNN